MKREAATAAVIETEEMKGIAARNIMLIKLRTFLARNSGQRFPAGRMNFSPGGRSDPTNLAAVTRDFISLRRGAQFTLSLVERQTRAFLPPLLLLARMLSPRECYLPPTIAKLFSSRSRSRRGNAGPDRAPPSPRRIG